MATWSGRERWYWLLGEGGESRVILVRARRVILTTWSGREVWYWILIQDQGWDSDTGNLIRAGSMILAPWSGWGRWYWLLRQGWEGDQRGEGDAGYLVRVESVIGLFVQGGEGDTGYLVRVILATWSGQGAWYWLLCQGGEDDNGYLARARRAILTSWQTQGGEDDTGYILGWEQKY